MFPKTLLKTIHEITARGHCLCISDVAEVLNFAKFANIHSFEQKWLTTFRQV
jgi:hypothetical protein